MSISDDLIERVNKIFYLYFKDDPEFQYEECDFEEKEMITEIDRDSSEKYDNQIHLHFKSAIVKVIKNLNITKNLTVYPYFYDFLPPSNITTSEIRYFVNKKEVKRENFNSMLFEKESVNADRNINFVFPKTCLKNIGNKLYINEFGREIVQLTINYINCKLINKLMYKNMWYEKRLEKIENALSIENENKFNKEIEMNLMDEFENIFFKDYEKQESINTSEGNLEIENNINTINESEKNLSKSITVKQKKTKVKEVKEKVVKKKK